jgi:formylglycine-generating enzyme required for sulfatase activity
LAETETTQRLYEAIMGDNPSRFKSDTTDLPAENMGSDKLNQFLVTIKEKTGYPFSCPTKEQWWHAAKGGNKTKNFKYSGSDNHDDVAWNYYNSYDSTKRAYITHPVKTKQPNELGFYDMSGNVSEICYSIGNYSEVAFSNPAIDISEDGYLLVTTRGGCGYDYNGGYYEYCTVTNRGSYCNSGSLSTYKHYTVGIRPILRLMQ